MIERHSFGEKALGITLMTMGGLNHILGAVDILNAGATRDMLSQTTDPAAAQTLRVEEGIYSQRAKDNFADGFVFGGLGAIAFRRRSQ